jgi:hypothetical protein
MASAGYKAARPARPAHAGPTRPGLAGRFPRPRALGRSLAGAAERAGAFRVELAIAATLIALGIALRLQQYLLQRSLWMDEAALALNVTERGYAGLLAPLNHDQAAPAAWLAVQKLLVSTFGPSELTFRLEPLMAGMAALALQYVVTRRLLGGPVALVATALVAIGSRPIYFSQEFKQYSTDQLVAVGLIGLLAGVHRRELSPARCAAIAAAGCAAIWFSHPAIFTLAGLGGVACVLACRERRWTAAAQAGALGLLWAATFGGAYLVYLRDAGDSPFLERYWRGSFAPFPIASLDDLRWYGHWFRTELLSPWHERFTTHTEVSPIPILCLAAGAVLLAFRRTSTVLYLAAPLGLLLVASALHRYPASDRMILFAVPTLAMVMGFGVVGVARLARGLAVPVGGLLAAALVAGVAPATADVVGDPYPQIETRPLFEYAAGHWREGDRLLVDGWGTFHWHYANVTGIPVEARLGERREASGDRLRRQLQAGAAGEETARTTERARVADGPDFARLRDQGRVWVIAPEGRGRRYSEALDAIGYRLDKFSVDAPGQRSEVLFLYGFDACTGACRVNTEENVNPD